MSRPSAPLQITLNLTGRCPLDCEYCYAQPFTKSELPVGVVNRLLDEAEQLGIFIVKIAGGEPLVHTRLDEILPLLANRRLGVAILTSAALPVRRWMKFLDFLLDHPEINLQVSLDSPDKETNDSTRGKGDLVVSNIERAIRSGIDLQIASVLTTRNIDTAEATVSTFFPDVRRFHFMNLMPTLKLMKTGRYAELRPSSVQLANFWARLDSIKKSLGSSLMIARDAEDVPADQILRYEGCSAAVTFCEVDSDGDVLACNISRSFVLGNVMSRSLADVWRSPEAEKIASVPVTLCSTYLGKNSPYSALESPHKAAIPFKAPRSIPISLA